MNIYKNIVSHFDNYRKKSPLDFLVRISLEYLIISVLLAIAFKLIGAVDDASDIDYPNDIIFLLVILAPIVETLLFQAFPIWIAVSFKVNFKTQVLLSTSLFCIVHILSNGAVNGIVTGLIGGFYFAFTFAHWRGVSRWKAYWITCLSHSIHNLLAFIIGAILESIGY